MSKKKSPGQMAAVMSAMWVLILLMSDLVKRMQELGCSIVETGENFYALAQTEGESTRKQIAQIIVEFGWKVRSVYSIFVDCGMSLSDMIALGKYDWMNPDINAGNFPIEEKVKANVLMRLFYFGKNMSKSAVEAEMDKEGWKPAKIWHLLFFGAKNPELQKRFPIIALGSVWGGCVAYLFWRVIDLRRYLYLRRIGLDFGGLCRFLAVRK